MFRRQKPGERLRIKPAGVDESLDEAAKRILKDKARVSSAYLEPLYTFGNIDRDPRMRVITVAYFALLPKHRFEDALKKSSGLSLAKITTSWKGEAGGVAEAFSSQGENLALAFDHGAILGLAVKRLRGKLATFSLPGGVEVRYTTEPDRVKEVITLQERQPSQFCSAGPVRPRHSRSSDSRSSLPAHQATKSGRRTTRNGRGSWPKRSKTRSAFPPRLSLFCPNAVKPQPGRLPQTSRLFWAIFGGIGEFSLDLTFSYSWASVAGGFLLGVIAPSRAIARPRAPSLRRGRRVL